MNKPSVMLKHNGSLISDEVYRIEKLGGTASICLNCPCPATKNRFWRVGDSVTADVADRLCQEGNYAVTILAPDTQR